MGHFGSSAVRVFTQIRPDEAMFNRQDPDDATFIGKMMDGNQTGGRSGFETPINKGGMPVVVGGEKDFKRRDAACCVSKFPASR